MNILYIDRGGVVSDDHMYQYYGDLYRELREMESVFLYEGPIGNISQMIESSGISFDCIIFGLGYFAQSSPNNWNEIEGLSEIEIPTVCLLHKPQTMLAEKLNFCKINNIDILADSQCTYLENGQIAETKSIRSWWSATPKHFYPRGLEKKYDVGFSGALHGSGKILGPTRDLRQRIWEILKHKEQYKIFWNGSDSVAPRIKSIEEYSTKICESKIWISTTGPVEDVGPRYFEVALSDTLLFCNHMPKQYEGVFKDGYNCVTFNNNLEDFEEKLMYYLKNDDERESIIRTANKDILENYTWKRMAEKLLKEIEAVDKRC